MEGSELGEEQEEEKESTETRESPGTREQRERVHREPFPAYVVDDLSLREYASVVDGKDIIRPVTIRGGRRRRHVIWCRASTLQIPTPVQLRDMKRERRAAGKMAFKAPKVKVTSGGTPETRGPPERTQRDHEDMQEAMGRFRRYLEQRSKESCRLTEERWEAIESTLVMLNAAERRAVKALIRRYHLAFAWTDEQRGILDPRVCPPVKIETMEHDVWSKRPPRLDPALIPEVVALLRQKVKLGVCESSNSMYSSGWFLLQKPGTQRKLRFIQDLRDLNAVCVALTGGPWAGADTVMNAAGRRWNSTLDLQAGYDGVIIGQSYRPLTALRTPIGRLQMISLPMGWINSVPVFCEAVERVLQPLLGDRLALYVDDVVVFGPKAGEGVSAPGEDDVGMGNPVSKEAQVVETRDELYSPADIRPDVLSHLRTLEEVFASFEQCGLTLSGAKLRLFQPQTAVLGFVVSEEGYRPKEQTVEAIVRHPVPSNPSELRSFLGIVSWVRDFVPNMARIAKPLYTLLRRDVRWQWSQACQRAFDRLRDIMATPEGPVLQAWDPHEDVHMFVDTSETGVGAVLCQRARGVSEAPTSANGEAKDHDVATAESVRIQSRLPKYLRPVRYYSAVHNRGKYHSAKLELYGFMVVVKHFGHLLRRRFHVYTDNLGITSLPNVHAVTDSHVSRWLDYLFGFAWTMRHVPREGNRAADHLSVVAAIAGNSANASEWRPYDAFPLPQELKGTYHDPSSREVDGDRPWEMHVCNMLLGEEEGDGKEGATLGEGMQDPGQCAARDTWFDPDLYPDPGLRAIGEYLAGGAGNQDTPERIIRRSRNFLVWKGRLYRRERTGRVRGVQSQVRLVPGCLEEALSLCWQCHVQCGHRGFDVSVRRFRMLYDYPVERERRAFEDLLKSCQICQRYARRRELEPVQNPTLAHTVMSNIHADLQVVSLSQGLSCPYLLELRDSLSGYLCAFALSGRADADILGALRAYVGMFGAPEVVISDRGEFHSRAVTEWLGRVGAEVRHTCAYHPQSNGISEGAHAVTIDVVLKALGDRPLEEWTDVLVHAIRSVNETRRPATGHSPHFLVFGQEANTPHNEVSDFLATQRGNFRAHMTYQQAVEARAYAVVSARRELPAVRARLRKSRERAVAYQNAHRRARRIPLEKGSLVMLYDIFGQPKNWGPRWKGPFRISAAYSNRSYGIVEPHMDDAQQLDVVHGDRLRPYHAFEDTATGRRLHEARYGAEKGASVDLEAMFGGVCRRRERGTQTGSGLTLRLPGRAAVRGRTPDEEALVPAGADGAAASAAPPVVGEGAPGASGEKDVGRLQSAMAGRGEGGQVAARDAQATGTTGGGVGSGGGGVVQAGTADAAGRGVSGADKATGLRRNGAETSGGGRVSTPAEPGDRGGEGDVDRVDVSKMAEVGRASLEGLGGGPANGTAVSEGETSTAGTGALGNRHSLRVRLPNPNYRGRGKTGANA